ncbi:hypothetical protein F2P81_016783 [Scophthalmus maximus]|uniref:Uncharacterized protein n=1 Tax=Scophthalmus maximus TaxID=52904 RepID=A0A6A4SI74_SCOMX|nr:hypothetical protein F2P81_016783 [Scophthalmus maximus]
MRKALCLYAKSGQTLCVLMAHRTRRATCSANRVCAHHGAVKSAVHCRRSPPLGTVLRFDSRLYCSDNAERCGVDSVDFIISHFHMNSSAGEAFNRPTYLCSALKVHNANVRARTELLTLSAPLTRAEGRTLP